jgi:hypothetical protein
MGECQQEAYPVTLPLMLHNYGISFQKLLADIKKVKVKVKCTLVQALRLCTGRTAHRGSRGIALLFHDQRH